VPGAAHVVAVTALLVAGTTGVAVLRGPAEEPTGATTSTGPEPRSDTPAGGRTGWEPGTSARTAAPRRVAADAGAAPPSSAGTSQARASGAPQGARPEEAPTSVDATMRIPELGVHGLEVVAYPGSPDDGPGTLIQNGGIAASPVGPRGGAGPGQVGNYIVTAHRTTSPAPFADLPELRRGDHVYVRALGRVFDYRVTRTRWTSFRSRRSLAAQSAAVPGRPGAQPTRAMITLSTCATPEDHARGNYWSDEYGNPEHRIDKIGVLVGVAPARDGAGD
jgi:sortase A